MNIYDLTSLPSPSSPSNLSRRPRGANHRGLPLPYPSLWSWLGPLLANQRQPFEVPVLSGHSWEPVPPVPPVPSVLPVPPAVPPMPPNPSQSPPIPPFPSNMKHGLKMVKFWFPDLRIADFESSGPKLFKNKLSRIFQKSKF